MGSGQRRGQEQRPGCGSWLVLLILLGLSIEYWYVTLPVLGVLIVVTTIVVKTDRRSQLHANTLRRPSVNITPPVCRPEVGWGETIGRVGGTQTAHYRARCDYCGAPRTHGANGCRYCGRSFLAG